MTEPAATTSDNYNVLDPSLTAGASWESICKSWILGRENLHAIANSTKLRAILDDPQAGARMVVNIGSFALLRMLQEPRPERYKNKYDLKRMGTDPGPSHLRQQVDNLIKPANAGGGNDLYFGAVALESAGVRFYGEYCLVLRRGGEANLQLFERDCYELVFEPFAGRQDIDNIAARLKGTWATDLVPMAIWKTRELLPDADRLVTEGRFREALLRGEEFIEVHRVGDFGIGDVEQVRQSVEDVSVESRIERAFGYGVLPKLEELVWVGRRAAVEMGLARRRLECRVVSGQGVR